MKPLQTLFLILFTASLYGQLPQKEFSNWFFADNNVFNFPDSVSDPLVSNDTSLNLRFEQKNNVIHFPSSICVSDSNGNILFYTISGKVFNRNNKPMLGSELVHEGIEFRKTIKRPNSSQYYLISDLHDNNMEVFSIDGKFFTVDMSLDKGLGGIVIDSSFYFPAFTEFINHPSGKFIWLLNSATKKDEDSTVYLYAYKFTENGIDTSDKVVSKIIHYPNHKIAKKIVLPCKISPDGKSLIISGVGLLEYFVNAYDNWTDYRDLLLDFDLETGKANNPRQLFSVRPFSNWGSSQAKLSVIDFSPNSNFFYFTNYYPYQSDSIVTLFQCPISIDKDTFIRKACIGIDSLHLKNRKPTKLQSFFDIMLAPNGKLYLTGYSYKDRGIMYNDSAISVIHNPNLRGDSCDFRFLDIQLVDKNPMALPSKVLPSLYYPQIISKGKCVGDTISFWITHADYDSIAWDWGDGEKSVSSKDTLQHVFKTAGNYLIFAQIYNEGEYDTTSFYKEIVGVTPLNLGADTLLCNGTDFLLDAQQQDYEHYLWGNDSSSSQIIISQEGSYKLEVSSVDGCKSSDSIFVGFIDCEISFENVCLSDSINVLISTSADSVIWDFGDNSPSITSYKNITSHKYKQSGVYTIVAEIFYKGLRKTQIEIVEIFDLPNNVNIEVQPSSGCLPLEVNFDIKTQLLNEFTYSFDFGNGNSRNGNETQKEFQYTYSQAGKYVPTIEITSDKNCKAEIIADSITVFPKPLADFTFKPDFPSMDNPIVNFQNLSNGANSFIWDIETLGEFYDFAPQVKYNDTGTHSVTLIAVSSEGCRDTSQANILVQNIFRIFIPNSFSPNGDGLNDVFKPSFMGVTEIDFSIYNRWGERLFHTQKDEAWDGFFDGNLMPIGVYVYTLTVKSFYGEKQYHKGMVSLVR